MDIKKTSLLIQLCVERYYTNDHSTWIHEFEWISCMPTVFSVKRVIDFHMWVASVVTKRHSDGKCLVELEIIL